MITADKRVERLGMTMPIPVEVSPIGVKHTERRLQTARCRDDDPPPRRTAHPI